MKTRVRLFIFVFVLFNLIFVHGLNASDEGSFLSGRDVTISMDLQDTPLKNVMKLLSIQSGLNFIASEGVQDRTITLYMEKVPLKDAMDQIFKANNLSYDLDKESNVFIVNDWGKPSTQTVTRVFYLKHATVSSASLTEEQKNNISSNASAATASSGGSSSGSTTSGGTDTGRWKVEEDAGITRVIKKLLSKDGSVIEDFRTNSLTVTDTPGRMEVIAQVVVSLDVSVPEVLLEVEMLDVSKNVVDQIGFKFGQTPFSMAFKGTSISTSFPFTPSMYSGREILKPITPGSVEFNTGNNGTSIYNIQLDFLRTQTDTKFLARPRILTLNNETAEIKILTNETIGVTSLQQGQGTAASVNTSAERAETGVSLRVTPQVDVDAGEITMFIIPTVKDTAVSSIRIGGGATGSFYRDPEERSTKSTVRVKDGETVVLGGLIRNQTSTIITKLPVLGDIPLLGALFRHKEQSPGRERELLVFITPHIMKSGKTTTPMPAKKVTLPLREQAKAIPLTRQQSVSSYLNNFEAKR
jgi:type IV pilus assembly protein PilQ